MEKSSCKYEVLYKVKEANNILHTIKRGTAKYVIFLLRFLFLESGTESLSRNVGKELSLHASQ
jgi:hypothetical protein